MRSWLDRVFPDRTLGVLGGATVLMVLYVYLRTVAPTVSFWDCGEFITCAYTLGIPHPPGAPLHVLLGRIFSLLPLSSDIAVRVNLLSSVPLAAAAGVAYFVLARLITWWYSDRYPDATLPLHRRLAIYSGSICGALFFAFATTNWANAVEAEVYGLSMFLMMALIWMTLIWVQRRHDPASDRYLVALTYLAFLSVTVHLTVFLVVPPIFLLIVVLSPRHRRDWRFWATGIVLLLIAVASILDFLTVSVAWLVITGLLVLARRRRWQTAFAMVIVALIGFSAYLYIPIRSTQNPTIDQNDPETWAAFVSFFERKQYGEKSMITRAFTRRGTWANQFGQHRRMGFWGFFDRQYGYNDALFLPIFFLGLLGLGWLIRRRRAVGAFFLLMLLLSSVGLVWYMNFADGTRYNPNTQDAYLEVRDRDYFFTPAFILFGMAIGLGGAVLVDWLDGNGILWPALGATIIAVMPVRTLVANYHVNDRSRNYIPYDYAYNILESADSSAVLFTNGDNDTFPVWCLQEVYGIRRDVRIANLSLLNTHWYILQLRDRMHVPMNLTDGQIARLAHYRKPDGTIKRIQDQMLDYILTANRWKEPINFATTVSAASRQYEGKPLDNHLEMMGMAYRLVRREGSNMVNLTLMEDRLQHVFKFRGLADPTVYKDPNTSRLIANYLSTFLVAADTLRRGGDLEGAERLIRMSLKVLPDEPDAYTYLSRMYAQMHRRDKLDSLWQVTERSNTDHDMIETNIALAYRMLADTARSVQIFEKVIARNPDYESAYRALVQSYYESRQYDKLVAFMEDWTNRHRDDEKSRQLLDQVKELRARVRNTNPSPDTGGSADTVTAESP